MSIIAVYNIKGGVGKTATAVNLAHLASQDSGRTLLCDMDPQGSASYYFRIRSPKKHNTGKLLKGGRHIERNIRGTDYPQLDLLPADFSYRNIDIALDDFKRSTQRISKILTPLTEDYQHIFLDSPPNITLLSENIFHAADRILVPVIPTTLSLNALAQLFSFLKETGLGRKKVLMFFSMAERRKRLHVDMMESMGKRPRVLQTPIPYLADVERMGLLRQPVTAALPRSIAAEAYRALWQEVQTHLHAQ